jgi:hypothetical protein
MKLKLLIYIIFSCLSISFCNVFQKMIGTYKHNNKLTVDDVKNFHWCVPPESENCARVLSYTIDDNASFECTHEVSVMKINQ